MFLFCIPVYNIPTKSDSDFRPGLQLTTTTSTSTMSDNAKKAGGSDKSNIMRKYKIVFLGDQSGTYKNR